MIWTETEGGGRAGGAGLTAVAVAVTIAPARAFSRAVQRVVFFLPKAARALEAILEAHESRTLIRAVLVTTLVAWARDGRGWTMQEKIQQGW